MRESTEIQPTCWQGRENCLLEGESCRRNYPSISSCCCFYLIITKSPQATTQILSKYILTACSSCTISKMNLQLGKNINSQHGRHLGAFDRSLCSLSRHCFGDKPLIAQGANLWHMTSPTMRLYRQCRMMLPGSSYYSYNRGGALRRHTGNVVSRNRQVRRAEVNESTIVEEQQQLRKEQTMVECTDRWTVSSGASCARFPGLGGKAIQQQGMYLYELQKNECIAALRGKKPWCYTKEITRHNYNCHGTRLNV